MTPAQDATHAQVERILQNKNLRLSEVQRRLLLYLVEKSLAGEADDLKEYAIGVDAFGKPPSYDPRQESVVRMHVARLRQKLSDYYHTDGAADPILVDLPKGGFKREARTSPRTGLRSCMPYGNRCSLPRDRWWFASPLLHSAQLPAPSAWANSWDRGNRTWW